jgi:glucose/arabinose dehydrogenase
MIPRFLHTTLFGLTTVCATAAEFTILNATAPARALVPSAANGGNAVNFVWQGEADPANIVSWASGNTGVGYDTDTGGGGNYIPQIGINVQTGMSGVNGSVFIRVPFTVNAAELPLYKSLALRMRYDDGFVAWINGTKVTSALEPANLSWNSLTLNGGSRNANLTGWDDFDITQHLGLLHEGTNMLAIQGLNATTGSSDLLVMPTLVASDIALPRWPTPIFTEVPGVGARSRPIAIRNAGDGSGKLYIAEQSGLIHQLTNGVLTSFMDISARVHAYNDSGGGNEQGFFGIAFSPNFAQTRRFYVSYSGAGGALTLSRFQTLTANPTAGDTASEQILLTIPHSSNTNHNGSDIHFGKDGYLYYSTGDGGGGGDTQNNAQNPSSLLGKMLRLDVEGNAGGGSLIPAGNPWAAAGDGVMDQIYHIGLRNPWRWSFDRLTGDMWIGDVGQDTSYEEIDFISGNTPGLNFQWRRREGLHDYNTSNGYGPGTLTEPILEKTGGDISVTGGYVYRGRAFPRMNGIYFYGDYGSGNFYGVQKDGNGVWRSATLRTDANSVTTFGEDEAGELYWASGSTTTARVYRITDGGSDSAYLSIVSSNISPEGRVTFTWGAANGRSYVPEVSTDMVNWAPLGPVQTGAASFRLSFTEASDPPPGTGRRYVRAREL